MKLFVTLFMILGCSAATYAQSGAVGPNGPNGSQGSGDNGRSYSNGNIPSQYEQNQNRPDSTLRSDDTTYMHQQWNDGSTQKQNADNTKKRSSKGSKNTQKAGTTSNKKKK